MVVKFYFNFINNSMNFTQLCSLCVLLENRSFVGQYELDIDYLQTLLDKTGYLKIVDKERGKNPNFEKEYVEPIVDFLKTHNIDVVSSLSRHSFADGYEYYIKKVHVGTPAPELEPWEVAKKKLERRRINRGHAHSGGASEWQMLRKVSRQKAIGQPLDNTFGYGKKDSKGRPLELDD